MAFPQQELWLFISSLCLSVPHPSLVLAANPMSRAGTRREQQGQGWSSGMGSAGCGDGARGTRFMFYILVSIKSLYFMFYY